MEERVDLITGSSRGIGRAIALDLARNGIRVEVNYRSRQEAAEGIAREIGRAGGRAMVAKSDVGADGEVKSMEADCENPATKELIERYLGGRKGVDAKSRLKVMKLIRDMGGTDGAGEWWVGTLHGGRLPAGLTSLHLARI